jgi:hypothetical protein
MAEEEQVDRVGHRRNIYAYFGLGLFGSGEIVGRKAQNQDGSNEPRREATPSFRERS